MEAYRVYTEVDWAETSRDKSNIQIDELCYKNNLKDALDYANEYIKKHFFRKDYKVRLNKYGNYQETDFCSWGKTIHVDKIEIN